MSDLVLNVDVAAAHARERLAKAINRQEPRSLGLFKTKNEYVGRVSEERFQIWERQLRAVHAIGRIEEQAGGTRIEVSFVMPVVTRALVALFFFLYALVVIGLALRPPDPALSSWELFLAVGGAVVLATGFVLSARRQRRNLRAFLEQLFAAKPR